MGFVDQPLAKTAKIARTAIKLDRVAPLITDPPPTSFTTL